MSLWLLRPLKPKPTVDANDVKGHDEAKGQVVAEGQVAAKGQVVAEGHQRQVMLIDGVAIVLYLVLLVNCIAIVLYLVFSLTKYSAIFTEVEGHFAKK